MGKEYAVTPSMREAVEKVNDLSRHKLRQVKDEEYQYREWKAWVQAPIITLESRIMQFLLGLLFVCIVLCVLFAPSSSHGNIVTASLVLFFPVFLISSIRAYVVIGGVLGITDEDLSTTFPFIFPASWQEAHSYRDKDMRQSAVEARATMDRDIEYQDNLMDTGMVSRQSIGEKEGGGGEGGIMPGFDDIHFATEDDGEVAVTANPMHKKEAGPAEASISDGDKQPFYDGEHIRGHIKEELSTEQHEDKGRLGQR